MRSHAEYYDQGKRDVKGKPLRQVYRFLRKKDVRKDLEDNEV